MIDVTVLTAIAVSHLVAPTAGSKPQEVCGQNWDPVSQSLHRVPRQAALLPAGHQTSREVASRCQLRGVWSSKHQATEPLYESVHLLVTVSPGITSHYIHVHFAFLFPLQSEMYEWIRCLTAHVSRTCCVYNYTKYTYTYVPVSCMLAIMLVLQLNTVAMNPKLPSVQYAAVSHFVNGS